MVKFRADPAAGQPNGLNGIHLVLFVAPGARQVGKYNGELRRQQGVKTIREKRSDAAAAVSAAGSLTALA